MAKKIKKDKEVEKVEETKEEEVVMHESAGVIILKAFLLAIWSIIKATFLLAFSLFAGFTLSASTTMIFFVLFGMGMMVIMWVVTGQIFFYWAPWMTRIYFIINIIGGMMGFVMCMKQLTPEMNFDNIPAEKPPEVSDEEDWFEGEDVSKDKPLEE